MGKLLSSPILKIILGVLLVPALVVNALMAYIIFAPSSMPKPFHLAYEYPGMTPEVIEAGDSHGSTHGSDDASHGESTDSGSGHGDSSSHGIMYDTGTKIINLAEPNGRRYIRVNIVLELVPSNPELMGEDHDDGGGHGGGGDPMEAFNTEMAAVLPIINDSIISKFSSKTFEDVYTADGKETIRAELVTMLNEKLPGHQILNVYFTEFVVQ